MNENTQANSAENPVANEPRNFRPKLAFVHPNMKGTGTSASFSLIPAYNDVDGCIWARFANQISVADRSGPTPVYARFDYENAINVKLGFGDLTKMLQVLRGETESIDEDRGLFHRFPGGQTLIRMKHQIEPRAGYFIEVNRTVKGKPELSSYTFLTPAEALGFAAAIESSFGVIAFGLPIVYDRELEAWLVEKERARNAVAA